MVDPRLIEELPRRARVSPSDAEAVLDALAQLGVEGRSIPARREESDTSLSDDARAEPPLAESYAAGAAEVDTLIASARQHPRGIDFLLGGHLGTVAVTFGTHAFTVEAARERIGSQR